MTKIETSSNLQHSYVSTEQYDAARENLLESRLRSQLQTLAIMESGENLDRDYGERLVPTPQTVSDTTLALYSLAARRTSEKGSLDNLRLYLDSARLTKTVETRDIALKALANSTLRQIDFIYYAPEAAQLEDGFAESDESSRFVSGLDSLLDYLRIPGATPESFSKLVSAHPDGNATSSAPAILDLYLQTQVELESYAKAPEKETEDEPLQGIYSYLGEDLLAFKNLTTDSRTNLLIAGKGISEDIEAIGASIAPTEVEKVVDPIAYQDADSSISLEVHTPTQAEILLLAEAEYSVAKKIAETTGTKKQESTPSALCTGDLEKIEHVIDIVLEKIPGKNTPELNRFVKAIQKARKTRTDPRIAAEVLADYTVARKVA